ncbi:MAG: efflux RND transporter periplasmic adaptor subunit [Pseudomonadota bacterium]
MRSLLRGAMGSDKTRPGPTRRYGAGCGLSERQKAATLASGVFLAALSVPAAHALAIEFDCIVKPSIVVSLGSPVAGILAEVPVVRGQRIDKGEIVARLEDSVQAAVVESQKLRAEDETALLAQRARLALAEAQMSRAEELLDRGTVSQQAYDEALAELEVNRAEIARLEMGRQLAETELHQAEAALALRHIESPMDALIVDRTLAPGELVSQDDHILRMAKLDPLHVEVFVPTQYFDALTPGLKVAITLRQPATTIESEVSVVDRVFDASSDTLRIRMDLENPDWLIPAGQRCTVSLDLGTSPDG